MHGKEAISKTLAMESVQYVCDKNQCSPINMKHAGLYWELLLWLLCAEFFLCKN